MSDLTPILLLSSGKPPENTNMGSVPSLLIHWSFSIGVLDDTDPEGREGKREREREREGGRGREREGEGGGERERERDM